MSNRDRLDYRTATKIAWGIMWRTVVTIGSMITIALGMMLALGIIRLSELKLP